MKLVTTYAALDLLGPAFTWTTPVYVDGPVRNGVLEGNLYIKGQGDPKLVVERLWLLLRRVQGLGIQTISGDIVLDRSAFEVADADPAAFDGERLRPYNAAPDALLINFKSVVMTFVPNRTTQTAQVNFEPPLAGVAMQATVPLSAGECGDWRAALARRLRRPGAHRLRRQLPGRLRREGLAGGVCRSAQLCGARRRRPVARDGRPAQGPGARGPRAGRTASRLSRSPRRRWPR